MAFPRRHKKDHHPPATRPHHQPGTSPASEAHAPSRAAAASPSSRGPAAAPTSWFSEASSSSSSMEALLMRPSTPPSPSRHRSAASSPISPTTSPSSILKYSGSRRPPGSSGSTDSTGSDTSTLRGRGKSVSFNDRTSVYNLPSAPGSTTASSNNSQEELWSEDVLPKYWRHETGSPPSTPEKVKGYFSPSSSAGAAPSVGAGSSSSRQEDYHQHDAFIRTTPDGEYMLPFVTPLGIEHIQFSRDELERYNALRGSHGAENYIPSLVEFLRVLRN